MLLDPQGMGTSTMMSSVAVVGSRNGIRSSLGPTSLRPMAPRCRKTRRNTIPYQLAVVVIWRSSSEGAAWKKSKLGRVDNWFDCMAIRYLSKSLQATSGLWNDKEGYESLVEVASAIALSLTPIEQQQLVIFTLQRALPMALLSLAKILLPAHKLTRECFAFFTTIFFAWLVGPCKVKESDADGSKEKNVVHIQKCRFLESTNCAGMCVNMCKMPSQQFIMETFGMPINMVPDFDDLSCELIFGQHPPSPQHDPALQRPCFKALCKTRERDNVDCSTS